MTNAEAKKHPMFNILCATGMGEKEVLRIIRTKVEEERLKNQATTEFSTEAKRIIVPASMNKMQASQELERQWHDEETMIEVDRNFDDWNWKDVLVAVKKTAEEHFGWVQGKTKYGMFGQKHRPKEIDVIVDIKNGSRITETCFYGAFTASAWEDAEVNVGAGYISCEVKKRYADDVKEFYNKVQKHLDEKSIYRGKAITVTRQQNPWGEVSLDFEVFELNVSDKIILNQDVEDLIQNFVIDDLGDEGKRCNLFSGGYGNGKTEVAMRVGAEGINKGMAFFYCKDAEMFDILLKQAVNYQPCIVFLEDVDEIAAGEQRDSHMNHILNTLDGVQTKGNSLTVIFTTNHENRINQALRRPGRIDNVVNFSNPDKSSIAKIYEAYLSDLDKAMNKGKGSKKLNYKKLAEHTADVPGAVVAEIAKRAVKLCKKREVCTLELVRACINSMEHHLRLMKEPIEKSQTGKMIIAIDNAHINSTPVDADSLELQVPNLAGFEEN